MDIRPIRNDDDHREALQEIERLWDYPDGSPENDKLDVLATLVEAYEKRRWPIDRPSPRDMLEYAITDMGRSQKELADVLGSRSLASALLSGKRKISLQAAFKISSAWKLPISSLLAPKDVHDAEISSGNHRMTSTAGGAKAAVTDSSTKTPKRAGARR